MAVVYACSPAYAFPKEKERMSDITDRVKEEVDEASPINLPFQIINEVSRYNLPNLWWGFMWMRETG